MYSLTNRILPLGVVWRQNIDGMMCTTAGGTGRAVDREGALVVFHHRIEIIRPVIIEAYRDVEVSRIVGLYISIVDRDIRAPIRTCLSVIEAQAVPKFVCH